MGRRSRSLEGTAFTKTDPAVGRESVVGEDPKVPVPGARSVKPRVHSIVLKSDNRFYRTEAREDCIGLFQWAATTDAINVAKTVEGPPGSNQKRTSLLAHRPDSEPEGVARVRLRLNACGNYGDQDNGVKQQPTRHGVAGFDRAPEDSQRNQKHQPKQQALNPRLGRWRQWKGNVGRGRPDRSATGFQLLITARQMQASTTSIQPNFD
jgi:hypothetical protein